MPDSPPPETPSPAPHHPPKRTFLGRLFNWSSLPHLAGLPELKQFPSQAHKDHALRQIAMGRIGGVMGFATRPLVLTLLSLVVTTAVFNWSPSVRFVRDRGTARGIDMALILISFMAVLHLFHRPVAARYMRKYLAGIGVKICRECGYDLRAAPPGAGRCPECGREVLQSRAGGRDS